MNVYFASAAPPVRYQNVYGIDMPARKELIAFDRNEQQIAALIGADRLFYQNLDDLKIATFKGSRTKVREFDCSVFNGEYVTGDITPEYLKSIELIRSDDAKVSVYAQPADPSPIDLHNQR